MIFKNASVWIINNMLHLCKSSSDAVSTSKSKPKRKSLNNILKKNYSEILKSYCKRENRKKQQTKTNWSNIKLGKYIVRPQRKKGSNQSNIKSKDKALPTKNNLKKNAGFQTSTRGRWDPAHVAGRPATCGRWNPPHVAGRPATRGRWDPPHVAGEDPPLCHMWQMEPATCGRSTCHAWQVRPAARGRSTCHTWQVRPAARGRSTCHTWKVRPAARGRVEKPLACHTHKPLTCHTQTLDLPRTNITHLWIIKWKNVWTDRKNIDFEKTHKVNCKLWLLSTTIKEYKL